MGRYNFNKQELQKLAEINAKLDSKESREASDLVRNQISEFWEHLKISEKHYINKTFHSSPAHEVEHMLSLHILNDLIDKGHLSSTLRDLGLPLTNISVDPFSDTSFLDGFVAEDGTLYAFSKFCQLDPLWTAVLVYYVWYKYIHPKGVHKFITKPKKCEDLKVLNSAKVAIIGDWGTGVWEDGSQEKCPAQLVLEGVINEKPDYVIHLGDVYYAGTKKEETENLLRMLRDKLNSKLFTMNSNHEMYDGANGLFDVAISNSIFSNQKGRSYFSLDVGEWVLVGLDSAYFDDSALYMGGSLFNKKGGQEQLKFLKEKSNLGKQLILLTHHNGISIKKDEFKLNEKLWGQVYDTLDGHMPDVWYWGHVHNGIVYKNKEMPILNGFTSKLGKTPKFRCCGHASMPFGNATGFYTKNKKDHTQTIRKELDYYSHTPMDVSNPTDSQKLRVLNGFAMLEISGNNITETFYEVSNNYKKPKTVWTNK